ATLRPSARTREKPFTNSSKCPRHVAIQIPQEVGRVLLETIHSISPMALFCLLLTPPAVTTTLRIFRPPPLLPHADGSCTFPPTPSPRRTPPAIAPRNRNYQPVGWDEIS